MILGKIPEIWREICRVELREILKAEGMDFPIPPLFWWSMDTFHGIHLFVCMVSTMLSCVEYELSQF